ncbi:MAG: serine hydrolase [candidate division Zixibacteria bacterium]|nr:serine hydrolase [candidate division Zixibacteria bacterium]
MLNFRDWKRRWSAYLLIFFLLSVLSFSLASPALGKSRIRFSYSKGFRLTAKSALVLDLDKGTVLYDKNCEEVRSIASLTKLMTAMVFLECGIDLFDTITISREDAKISAKSRLRPGETFYLIDLLHASLMPSDNRATRALVRATGLSPQEFVGRMNRKADSLSLVNTEFSDPTGLDADNVSTAWETAKLLKVALSYPLISQITTRTLYKFFSVNKRRRIHQLSNSNRLLRGDFEVLGGKTGFIGKSGWCLAVMLKNIEEKLCVVILGSASNMRRFAEARHILKSVIQLEPLEKIGFTGELGPQGQ